LEKKMMSAKERELSFQEDGKESIQDRLKQLFKGRNLRRTAQDWGLPYSTLNNYFTKGAKPGLDVVENICKVENVSLQWLITGEEIQDKKTANSESVDARSDESLRSAWLTAFEYMSKAEAEALLKLIIRGGARGLIKLAQLQDNQDTSLEEEFMLLPPELKERAMLLIDAHIEAKKGIPEERQNDESNSLTSKKQAV
jgi:DNA-binding phage protein